MHKSLQGIADMANETFSPKVYHFSTKKNCNYTLPGRMVVENAFWRFKARWRRLMKRNMQVENIPTVVVAVCVLHNICEVHNETFYDSWLARINDNDNHRPQSMIQEVLRLEDPNKFKRH